MSVFCFDPLCDNFQQKINDFEEENKKIIVEYMFIKRVIAVIVDQGLLVNYSRKNFQFFN